MRSLLRLLLLFLALPAAVASEALPAPRPNLVYMICDDLGYGDVHGLNPERGKIPTPNVDRLAAQGLTFTDAHGGSSVCTPTRYGIQTGRYAWRTRLQSGVLDGSAPPLIAEGRLTVGELLRRNGYRTAAIGKWHLGYRYDRAAGAAPEKGDDTAEAATGKAGIPVGTRVLGGPVTRGFDAFFGFHHAREMRALVENDRVVEDLEPVDMLPRLTQRAVAWIGERAPEAKAGKPFFLYLAFNSPHTPIVPAPAWKGRSGLGDYGDFVMQTDAAAGEVLKALDAAGLAESTLVFFASDNGCSPAAKVASLERQGHYPSARFRGYKSDIWEGGHRIPFVVRWPGVVRPGASCHQLVCLTDLMATCADLVGAKLPDDAGEDSVSLLPLLKGEDRPVREAVVHHSIAGRFSIRQGGWKLERCPGSGGWGEPGDAEALKQGLPDVQLYDLAKDDGEQTNVQSEHPDVVERLAALLEKIVEDGRSTPGAPQKNDVAVDVRKADGKGGGKKAVKQKAGKPAKP